MRLLLRCSIAAFVFSIAVVLVTVLTFNGPLAMLGWPGLLIMDAVYARFGIYVDSSKNLLPWLLPGFLIDVAAYTILFFVLDALWRTLVPKSQNSLDASPTGKRPTTNDQRRVL
jgi:hypothetical protein